MRIHVDKVENLGYVATAEGLVGGDLLMIDSQIRKTKLGALKELDRRVMYTLNSLERSLKEVKSTKTKVMTLLRSEEIKEINK